MSRCESKKGTATLFSPLLHRGRFLPVNPPLKFWNFLRFRRYHLVSRSASFSYPLSNWDSSYPHQADFRLLYTYDLLATTCHHTSLQTGHSANHFPAITSEVERSAIDTYHRIWWVLLKFLVECRKILNIPPSVGTKFTQYFLAKNNNWALVPLRNTS